MKSFIVASFVLGALLYSLGSYLISKEPWDWRKFLGGNILTAVGAVGGGVIFAFESGGFMDTDALILFCFLAFGTGAGVVGTTSKIQKVGK
jgi:hypothetical protein